MRTDGESHKFSREKAITYCKELIEYYKSCRKRFRDAWYGSQAATVILSAATPILILGGAPPVVQAIPPTLASISGGLAVFRWQENWIISKSTQEALEAELIAFEIGVTESYRVTEDKAVDNFITRINTLHLDQVKEWSAVLMRNKLLPKNSDNDLENSTVTQEFKDKF
ncbi:DUF4231 domain-containing protein [Nostoc sp. UHCC 0870]|uniref:DUF4231 domain-containing protein n=1 Tax=Nostoc sp. UHCC 0870 TaxID=2914041 RepID=UPI001EDEF266|nr:DUF4231 domain-containing protein [Nostoc sp. UHCC 0870]UKP01515.1 DUF4231 domain-containing protein [Nostoc sp. UHCC 0870]